jgi:hypothetical protein
MRGAPNAARAAPARAGGDPQKTEQLPGRLDFKNSLADVLQQVRNLVGLVSAMDPALVAGLAFALLGGARQ